MKDPCQRGNCRGQSQQEGKRKPIRGVGHRLSLSRLPDVSTLGSLIVRLFEGLIKYGMHRLHKCHIMIKERPLLGDKQQRS